MKSLAMFKEYIVADFQRYEPRPFFLFLYGKLSNSGRLMRFLKYQGIVLSSRR